MCVVLQSSLGGAGDAEKEAGKIRAGVQRAQADRGEAGNPGRARKSLCRSPAWSRWTLSCVGRNRTPGDVTAGGAVVSRGLGRGVLPNRRHSDHSPRPISERDPARLWSSTAAPRAGTAVGAMMGGILPVRARGPPGVCTCRAAQTPWQWAVPRGVPRESLISSLARTDVTSRCHRRGVRG